MNYPQSNNTVDLDCDWVSWESKKAPCPQAQAVLSLAWLEAASAAVQPMVLLPPAGQKWRQVPELLLLPRSAGVWRFWWGGGGEWGGAGPRTWFTEEVVQSSVNRSNQHSWKVGTGTAIVPESLGDTWTPFSYRLPPSAALRKGTVGG